MALRAFVVEDNPAILQSLVEALDELAGVETRGSASTEKDAVAWLTDSANEWDVAIVDLVLVPGGGSGFGVLRALRGRPPSRKMVVLTGTASAEALGGDGVFDKSMETEALIDWCLALAQEKKIPPHAP